MTSPISYPNFTDWRNQNHVFEKIGVYNRNSYNLTGYGDAETHSDGADVCRSFCRVARERCNRTCLHERGRQTRRYIRSSF